MLREQPSEIACAGMSNVRELLRRPVSARVATDSVLHAMNDRVDVISMEHPRGQRRVRSRSPEVNHEFSRHGRCDSMPVLTPDEVQREIDAGGDARAREDPAILDEDAIGVDAGLRFDVAQLFHMIVVSSAFLSAQQPRMPGNHASSTDAHERERFI